jgi:hypothetical protein
MTKTQLAILSRLPPYAAPLTAADLKATLKDLKVLLTLGCACRHEGPDGVVKWSRIKECSKW